MNHVEMLQWWYLLSFAHARFTWSAMYFSFEFSYDLMQLFFL